MFSIGEFSKITGLTVKALRLYHEEGLLIPSSVDAQTGYRYYDPRLIQAARTIALLRKLEFPLSEIKTLLHYDSEYKEGDADFEACMPIRNQKQIEGVSIRPLEAGRCVS